MRTLALALLALVLVPSLAHAGGGTKNTGKIRVTNTSTGTVGVIVNPPSTLNPATATQAQFTAAGGRFVSGGANTTFTNLKAGANTVAAFYIDTATTPAIVGAAATSTVTVKSGATAVVRVAGDVLAAPTITIVP